MRGDGRSHGGGGTELIDIVGSGGPLGLTPPLPAEGRRHFNTLLNYLRMNEVIIDPGISTKGILAGLSSNMAYMAPL